MSLDNVPFIHIAFARKPETWEDSSIPEVTSQTALLAVPFLEVFPATPLPLDTLPDGRPQYFIAERPNGDRFLINTEGYNYGRYVARIAKEAK